MIGAGAAARAEIPLSLVTVPDESGSGYRQQLWIYLGINDAQFEGQPVVRPYLFDTGSAMFNAAYYAGAGANPNKWTDNAVVLGNSSYSYGRGSGITDYLDVVTVSSIKVYRSQNDTTARYTFSANATNPNSDGYVVGKVTSTTMALSGNYSSLQDALANNAAYVSGVFGTFGAAMFTDTVSSSSPSGNAVVGSVLGQSTTTGWTVVANTPSTSQPFVILGLDDATRAQFSSDVTWSSTGNNTKAPFPNSGATSGKEFDTLFNYSVQNGGQPVDWSGLTLLDTGTANTNFGNATAHTDLQNGGLLDSGDVIDGSTFEATGNSTLTPNQSYSFTTNSTYQVDGQQVSTLTVKSFATGSSTTMGINFFLNNSVAFDLQNQQTLYTSNVVPEPSISALLILACGTLVLGLLCARHPDPRL
jgi:hypothetical protein